MINTIRTCLSPSTNFGDIILNEKIYNFFTNKNPILISTSNNLQQLHYLFSGSILSKANKYSHVWGSGFISSKDIVEKPAKIYAVRGKHTYERLSILGIDCPKVFGDPALLCPLIYNPQVNKKYKYGIIPHYVHKNCSFVINHLNLDNVLYIDILGGFEKVIEQIKQCDIILSSTLHGLIVADAYGVPSYWIKFEDGQKLCGDDMKFYDYFSSVDRRVFSWTMKKDSKIEKFEFHEYKIDLREVRNRLLEVCPINDNYKL